MTKIHQYGTCYLCQSPIEIPGLDIYKCSKPGCGQSKDGYVKQKWFIKHQQELEFKGKKKK